MYYENKNLIISEKNIADVLNKFFTNVASRITKLRITILDKMQNPNSMFVSPTTQMTYVRLLYPSNLLKLQVQTRLQQKY